MDNLLIGVIESEQQIEEQSSDWNSFTINKIGGYPVLSPNTSNDLIRSFNSLVCDLCKKSLAFVLQIYCPVDDSPNDRLIHLFVCINRECLPNKWFAVRTITPFIDQKEDKTLNTPQNNVWIEGQTDWGTDELENINEETNNCSTSLAKLSVGDTKCQSIVLESMAYFQPMYISVIDEPLDSGSNDKHINNLMESYERNNSEQKSSHNFSETYEQNYLQTIYKNDRKNYEFFKCLSVFPKQIIRYEWRGTPLINSDVHNPIRSSECESCGTQRLFEFQLMPALISYLKALSDTFPSFDIDFGTVLIYSCGQNCVKSNCLLLEQTIVLSDPDNEAVDKFNK